MGQTFSHNFSHKGLLRSPTVQNPGGAPSWAGPINISIKSKVPPFVNMYSLVNLPKDAVLSNWPWQSKSPFMAVSSCTPQFLGTWSIDSNSDQWGTPPIGTGYPCSVGAGPFISTNPDRETTSLLIRRFAIGAIFSHVCYWPRFELPDGKCFRAQSLFLNKWTVVSIKLNYIVIVILSYWKQVFAFFTQK